jgi:hypothetical protein
LMMDRANGEVALGRSKRFLELPDQPPPKITVAQAAQALPA